MDKGKKVLNIVPTPFFAERGCHMRILGEMKALAHYGYQNTIVTYHHGRDVADLDIRRIVNVPWYRKLEAGPSWHKFYIDFLLFFKALGVYIKEKPDIIYGHLHEGAFVGGMIKYLFTWGRVPLVFDVQGSLTAELETFDWFRGIKKPLRWFFHTFEKFICKMPDFFICSSVSNGDIIKERFGIAGDKVKVVIDGVHTDFFNIEPKESLKDALDIPQDVPVVIFTGALLAAKGVDNLVAAMPGVLNKVPDAHFLVVGYPVKDTQKKVEALGIADKVHFTGMVDYFQLPSYLAISDIALEPKMDKAGEASGKVINYMGAALPVVCFDSKNNRRFLAQSGIYAQDGSIDDFVDKIVWAIHHPDKARQLGEKARQRVEEVFSWNSSIQDTVEAFKMLTSKRGRRN